MSWRVSSDEDGQVFTFPEDQQGFRLHQNKHPFTKDKAPEAHEVAVHRHSVLALGQYCAVLCFAMLMVL